MQPPFSWTLLISSWCRCGLLGFNAEICRPPLGRPAWVRHVSALRFTDFLTNMCMKSKEVVPGQKIRVSAAGWSFNPCARPFGPFDQTNLQSMVYRQCVDVTTLLDQRHSTVCRGARPAGLWEAGRPGIWPIFPDFW